MVDVALLQGVGRSDTSSGPSDGHDNANFCGCFHDMMCVEGGTGRVKGRVAVISVAPGGEQGRGGRETAGGIAMQHCWAGS